MLVISWVLYLYIVCTMSMTTCDGSSILPWPAINIDCWPLSLKHHQHIIFCNSSFPPIRKQWWCVAYSVCLCVLSSRTYGFWWFSYKKHSQLNLPYKHGKVKPFDTCRGLKPRHVVAAAWATQKKCPKRCNEQHPDSRGSTTVLRGKKDWFQTFLVGSTCQIRDSTPVGSWLVCCLVRYLDSAEAQPFFHQKSCNHEQNSTLRSHPQLLGFQNRRGVPDCLGGEPRTTWFRNWKRGNLLIWSVVTWWGSPLTWASSRVM